LTTRLRRPKTRWASPPLDAAPLHGKTHELTNVAALEARRLMQDACGSLEARRAMLRRRVVRVPDRVTGLGRDLLAVHE
jgi:hypothetical protein